jgi:hypothetical protein
LSRRIAEAGPEDPEWHAEYFPETCVIASSPRLKKRQQQDHRDMSAHVQVWQRNDEILSKRGTWKAFVTLP